jgi:hypothetical protein
MRMDHGVDIGPTLVDLQVKSGLHRRFAFPFNPFLVKIQNAHFLQSELIIGQSGGSNDESLLPRHPQGYITAGASQ